MASMSPNALNTFAAPQMNKAQGRGSDSFSTKEQPNVLSRYFIKPKKGLSPSVEVVRVQSSNVKALGYDHAQQLLYITFGGKNRPEAIYRYYQVPAQVFEAAKRASSVGRFVYYAVRMNYYYQKV